jgi:hypothetical protein
VSSAQLREKGGCAPAPKNAPPVAADQAAQLAQLVAVAHGEEAEDARAHAVRARQNTKEVHEAVVAALVVDAAAAATAAATASSSSTSTATATTAAAAVASRGA